MGYPGEDPRMGTLVLEGDIMQEIYVGLTPSFQEQEVSLTILCVFLNAGTRHVA